MLKEEKVMEPEMQWKPLPLSKEEIAWVETFNSVQRQVLSAFSLPAEMVQPKERESDEQNAKIQGVEQERAQDDLC